MQDALKPLPCNSLLKHAEQRNTKTFIGQPVESKPRTTAPSAELREEPIADVRAGCGAMHYSHMQHDDNGPKRTVAAICRWPVIAEVRWIKIRW